MIKQFVLYISVVILAFQGDVFLSAGWKKNGSFERACHAAASYFFRLLSVTCYKLSFAYCTCCPGCRGKNLKKSLFFTLKHFNDIKIKMQKSEKKWLFGQWLPYWSIPILSHLWDHFSDIIYTKQQNLYPCSPIKWPFLQAASSHPGQKQETTHTCHCWSLSCGKDLRTHQHIIHGPRLMGVNLIKPMDTSATTKRTRTFHEILVV